MSEAIVSIAADPTQEGLIFKAGRIASIGSVVGVPPEHPQYNDIPRILAMTRRMFGDVLWLQGEGNGVRFYMDTTVAARGVPPIVRAHTRKVARRMLFRGLCRIVTTRGGSFCNDPRS